MSHVKQELVHALWFYLDVIEVGQCLSAAVCTKVVCQRCCICSWLPIISSWCSNDTTYTHFTIVHLLSNNTMAATTATSTAFNSNKSECLPVLHLPDQLWTHSTEKRFTLVTQVLHTIIITCCDDYETISDAIAITAATWISGEDVFKLSRGSICIKGLSKVYLTSTGVDDNDVETTVMTIWILFNLHLDIVNVNWCLITSIKAIGFNLYYQRWYRFTRCFSFIIATQPVLVFKGWCI